MNYAWNNVAEFLKNYKNSLHGIKNSGIPALSEIYEELRGLYKEQYDETATSLLKDKEIEKALTNFPGDSTIPGFPSIDAFLALLSPLLKKLQSPVFNIITRVHDIL